ncbi:IS66 family insertion sequence element accessory protein TnpB [Bradyrhizobium sp. CB82]|uniref:IS66 family insertion sequence element accessory protein TnpB n=1 Tax=Bradyrhizobium sp. CB82 TaxID=3039159 RepID=UPI0024B26E1E|nr:IS66 family insertion sequence element accessory protein TnpB [Bradyrhizobium sp. CB82]WFU43581.1 IS66 family insertion sequence element accessory protein TnpB [Bradyrhizobium sp. CB82]
MIPAGVQVYVASTPVDFRKGAIGLMALVRDGGIDPFSGALHVFRSKRADKIKIVWFDGTGVCLFAKTLGNGVLLAEDCADPGAAEPCAIARADRWAGLDEGASGGGEAPGIGGLTTCGELNQGG